MRNKIFWANKTKIDLFGLKAKLHVLRNPSPAHHLVNSSRNWEFRVEENMNVANLQRHPGSGGVCKHTLLELCCTSLDRFGNSCAATFPI